MEVTRISRSVYPPSFCKWQVVLGVMALTQLSVFLIGIGRLQQMSWQWLSITSAFGQILALSSTMVVCLSRPWLKRMTVRNAWVVSWVIAVLTTIAVGYSLAIVGSVLGFGPGRQYLGVFMLESTLAVGLVSMALLRYLFIRSQWQAELIAQADARVQALQARIRPHFLFNSLNTIASLIDEEPESAERATEDLAELFRGSMRRADAMIPLAEELELGRRFLDMEQRRLGSRLQVSWDVAGLPEQAKVLPLILQPLLENAVIHGIQVNEEGGEVRVYGRGESDSMVITISNPLVAVSDHQQVGPKRHGMALRNIRKRLDLAFGERASLITHEDDKQFFAVLTMPNDTNTHS